MTRKRQYFQMTVGLAILANLVFACLAASALQVASDDLPGPDQAQIEEFLSERRYEQWDRRDRRISGASVGDTEYTAHGYMEVYYSPGVKQWAQPAKGASMIKGALANNEMIVALQFSGMEDSEPERILSMVRWNGDGKKPGSHDGWFWSEVYPKGADKTSSGKFGNSRCLSCHVSADNESLVFLRTDSEATNTEWDIEGLKMSTEVPKPDSRVFEPEEAGDEKFLIYFGLAAANRTDFDKFPSQTSDHVIAERSGLDGQAPGSHFVTSDQCDSCHNASQLHSNTKPNMWYPEPDPDHALVKGNPDKKVYRNFSPYGEWSASLNGLSGRDPAWHAQVEFERRLRPELAEFTTATCFSCHGPMAGRQLDIDGKGSSFNIEMFYATAKRKKKELKKREEDPNTSNIGSDSKAENAKYGALARDGVSCAVCHLASAKNLGVDPKFDPMNPTRHLDPAQLNSYSALFSVETQDAKNAYWGPYEEGKLTESKVSSLAMDKALGLRARHGPLLHEDSPFLQKFPQLGNSPQIHESKLCGSCHTVIVPALRVGYGVEDPNFHRDRDGKLTKDPFLDQGVKMSFEQTTYFEWRNSRYENEVELSSPTAMTCQACHMAAHLPPPEQTSEQNGEPRGRRIVNVLSDRYPPTPGRALGPSIHYTKKDPIYRHVLLGINFFVFEMYEQFPDLLGLASDRSNVPEHTLEPVVNARDWIENHAARITADLKITMLEEREITTREGRADYLEAEVEITNLAGHKFPTGAGFRRAFIKFEVLDENGKPLWISGGFDTLGVLGEPKRKSGKIEFESDLPSDLPFELAKNKVLLSEETLIPWESQPHHQVITREDQAQIYETRALNSVRNLQTTVLGIYDEYKDNRILPNGWETVDVEHLEPDSPTKNLYAMLPLLVGIRSEQPHGVEVAPPEGVPFEDHHPVLTNIERDQVELPDEIRPPELRPEEEGKFETIYDPDYWSSETRKDSPGGTNGAQRGQDHVVYRVPLDEIGGWASVRARLYYQTIPPYYLRDRFINGIIEDDSKSKGEEPNALVHGPDLKRLAYMASHLHLKGTKGENWSLQIGSAATKAKANLGKPYRLTNEDLEDHVHKRLKKHYHYLNLQERE